MNLKEINNRIEQITNNTVVLSYSEIDNLIEKAVNSGLKEVENPITAALNAAHAIGKIQTYMFLYDHHVKAEYIDCLISLHDKYKNDIEKLLQIQDRLYRK